MRIRRARQKLVAGNNFKIICCQCHKVISEGKVPEDSVYYGNGFGVCVRCGNVPLIEIMKKMLERKVT